MTLYEKMKKFTGYTPHDNIYQCRGLFYVRDDHVCLVASKLQAHHKISINSYKEIRNIIEKIKTAKGRYYSFSVPGNKGFVQFINEEALIPRRVATKLQKYFTNVRFTYSPKNKLYFIKFDEGAGAIMSEEYIK